MPLVSFPQPLSADRLPKEPSPQQAADCTQLPGFPSAPHQCQRTLSRVVAAYSPPKVSFLRKGAAAPQKSRVSASLRSTSPLSLRSGHALDCFHPAYKSTYRAFSESPLFLFFFCLLPRSPRHGVPERSSLCFFCLAGARTPRAGGADSVKPCPTTGGHPKGVGLEGIRGASYALTVPAKQKRVRNFSRTGNKLQVKVFAQNPFDGFGDLAVEPSLKPRDGKPVWH